MKIRTGMVISGGFTAAVILLLLYILTKSTLISFCVYAGATLLFYILASTTISVATGFSEFMRGMMIGINAVINGIVLFYLFDQTGSPGFAIGLAPGLSIINFLAVVRWVSQSEVYQGVIGWANWFMPMSWPIVLLGLLFLIFSLLLAAATGFQVEFLKLQGIKIDWPTGTIFIKGGLVSNLNAWDTAFNMGNFAFVDMNSSGWHIQHESGHTLNLAAFGFIFHLIGTFDELVLRQGNAYSERLADSNSGSANNIPMWA
ncbi:MAG: hypothetical protein ACU85E_15575 [Gammaproteobacteria bacterium]